jgi:hypothetical protein
MRLEYLVLVGMTGFWVAGVKKLRVKDNAGMVTTKGNGSKTMIRMV